MNKACFIIVLLKMNQSLFKKSQLGNNVCVCICSFNTKKYGESEVNKTHFQKLLTPQEIPR